MPRAGNPKAPLGRKRPKVKPDILFRPWWDLFHLGHLVPSDESLGYYLLPSGLIWDICEQCGEPLFEEQEVEAIQDIVKAVDEKCRLLRQSA